MSKYTELKAKHQAEVNAFPLGFAFNQSQFDEMMTKWGLKSTDIREILSIGGGGYVRKDDAKAMHEMFDRHDAELKAAMQDFDFAYEAFNYELANHEYCITYDATEAIAALGLSMKEINASFMLKSALKKAIAAQEDC